MSNKCPQHRRQTGIKEAKQVDNTRIVSQRQRLIEWLREKPISTIEARHLLNILAPAPRIFELRHIQNLNIKTVWTEAYTPERHKHMVAKYVLLPGKFKGGCL